MSYLLLSNTSKNMIHLRELQDSCNYNQKEGANPSFVDHPQIANNVWFLKLLKNYSRARNFSYRWMVKTRYQFIGVRKLQTSIELEMYVHYEDRKKMEKKNKIDDQSSSIPRMTNCEESVSKIIETRQTRNRQQQVLIVGIWNLFLYNTNSVL